MCGVARSSAAVNRWSASGLTAGPSAIVSDFARNTLPPWLGPG
jgi:hypothetical protein